MPIHKILTLQPISLFIVLWQTQGRRQEQSLIPLSWSGREVGDMLVVRVVNHITSQTNIILSPVMINRMTVKIKINFFYGVTLSG